jgi:hypothetical protein
VLLILLLLSSVFIGLFAGAQHKLNKHKGDGGHGDGGVITTTATVTTTATGPVPTGKDVCTFRVYNGEWWLMVSMTGDMPYGRLHPPLSCYPVLHRRVLRSLRELLRVRQSVIPPAWTIT